MTPFRILALVALLFCIGVAFAPFVTLLAVMCGLTAIALDCALTWAIRRWRK